MQTSLKLRWPLSESGLFILLIKQVALGPGMQFKEFP